MLVDDERRAACRPACTNGVKDENEEGTDCGLACPAKCTGAGCTADAECGSGKCNPDGKCAAPAGKPCGVGAPIAECTDGEKCELDKDCKSGFCDANVCKTPPQESHTDGKKNSGETGIDCGGSVKATAPCPDGQGCIDSTDCVGTCTANVCGPIGPTDGKKNGSETDIDCGGATAPKCANGKACLVNGDCTDDYCPDATKKCTAPTYDDGVKNGNETDIDCGGNGVGMKKCGETRVCVVDADCVGACSYLKKCVDAPSCKNHFGGDTCGTFEPGDAFKGHVTNVNGTTAPGHESCCRALPVAGYTDANHAGKTVYLDKYEISAGRMRAFIEFVTAKMGGPNVRAYMAANRPARWHNDWEGALPTSETAGTTSFTITSPTAAANLLYPGQDQYLLNNRTQNTWYVINGNYNINAGLYYSLQGAHLFPEYLSDVPPWQSADYAASHALNCSNAASAYGYSTYWFDAATVSTYGGGIGKFFTKDELDQKAMTCAPFGLFAAFCAWDGGQLATSEVIDAITGNTGSPVYGPTTQNGKFTGGQTTCGGVPHKYITYPDGGGVPCADVYFYPNDQGNNYDGSSRIAPPGRVPGDTMSIAAGDEPWMDMMGNLEEAVLKTGETQRFDWRGYGTEWSSISHHRNQASTARMKGGAFGARCMRFK